MVAKISTDKEAISCALFEDRAPITVANFVGLAASARSSRPTANGRRSPATTARRSTAW
ncbi:MAG: peptidylprolyl isomerase [Polyangiaceae bacterium]